MATTCLVGKRPQRRAAGLIRDPRKAMHMRDDWTEASTATCSALAEGVGVAYVSAGGKSAASAGEWRAYR
jgi:hypothetical protein